MPGEVKKKKEISIGLEERILHSIEYLKQLQRKKKDIGLGYVSTVLYQIWENLRKEDFALSQELIKYSYLLIDEHLLRNIAIELISQEKVDEINFWCEGLNSAKVHFFLYLIDRKEGLFDSILEASFPKRNEFGISEEIIKIRLYEFAIRLVNEYELVECSTSFSKKVILNLMNIGSEHVCECFEQIRANLKIENNTELKLICDNLDKKISIL